MASSGVGSETDKAATEKIDFEQLETGNDIGKPPPMPATGTVNQNAEINVNKAVAEWSINDGSGVGSETDKAATEKIDFEQLETGNDIGKSPPATGTGTVNQNAEINLNKAVAEWSVNDGSGVGSETDKAAAEKIDFEQLETGNDIGKYPSATGTGTVNQNAEINVNDGSGVGSETDKAATEKIDFEQLETRNDNGKSPSATGTGTVNQNAEINVNKAVAEWSVNDGSGVGSKTDKTATEKIDFEQLETGNDNGKSPSATATGTVNQNAEININRAVAEWSVNDVRACFILNGLEEEAETFYREEIDGLCLLLMTRRDIVHGLKFGLRPALKIHRLIYELQLNGHANIKTTGSISPPVPPATETVNQNAEINVNKAVAEWSVNDSSGVGSETDKAATEKIDFEQPGLGNDIGESPPATGTGTVNQNAEINLNKAVAELSVNDGSGVGSETDKAATEKIDFEQPGLGNDIGESPPATGTGTVNQNAEINLNKAVAEWSVNDGSGVGSETDKAATEKIDFEQPETGNDIGESPAATGTGTVNQNAEINLNKTVAEWSVNDVRAFFILNGLEEEADIFYRDEIDGLTLLLMTRQEIVHGLKMLLGPALKIHRLIYELQLNFANIKTAGSKVNGDETGHGLIGGGFGDSVGGSGGK